jgi:hypothetical protein
MSMRVSWIDETHLQALLGRLEAPLPVEAEMDAPELETLPDEDDGPLSFFEDEEPVKPGASPRADEFPELPTVAEEVQTVPEPVVEPAPMAEAEMAPPLDRIRERLKLIRHRAAEAGILSHTLPLPEASAPVIESPETRLAAFAKQVLARLPEESKLLILDADGEVLWNNNPKPGLILSTLMALKAVRVSSAVAIQQVGEVSHHPLSGDEVLSVFTHATPSGPLRIAIKARAAIGAEVIAPYRALL